MDIFATIRIDNLGDYYQVYWVDETVEFKMGNIWPNEKDGTFLAEDCIYNPRRFNSLRGALGYLVGRGKD